jgi:elongation factor Ts
MKLRNRTNAPMMDCKQALLEANGDMEKAAEIIRKKNAAIQEKKAEREAAEGRVAVCIDPAKSVAAILEMRCESAPVAKNDAFIALANDVVKHIAMTESVAASPEALQAQPYAADPKRTVKDRIGETIGLIRENMKPARFVRLSGGHFGSYIHHDGSTGVLLQVEGAQADPAVLKDVCMHIAARQPRVARREEVDPALLEREREIARAQAAATGKPANILDKIAEGKLKAWYAENVLVEQPFVKDEKKTVGDLLKGAGLSVKKFVRYKVGEVS